MYVRVKTTPNSPRKSVQLVESMRKGGKVVQRIVRHIGIAADENEEEKLKGLAEYIKAKLEHERNPKLFASEVIVKLSRERKGQGDKLIVNLRNFVEEQRLIQGVHDVYGKVYDQLGFSQTITNPRRHQSAVKTIKNIVLARIANPVSKRASVTMLEKDFGVRIQLEKVYRAMDKLDKRAIKRIKQRAYENTVKLLPRKLNVIFIDVTTIYFESIAESELLGKGYSKDRKHDQSQVLLCLLVTKEGLPIGYEVFPGSTFEGHTLIPVLDKVSEEYTIDKVIFVADSGLFSHDNLKELEEHGYEYVVGARIRNLSKKLTKELLNEDNYEEVATKNDTFRIATFSYQEGKELIVSYSYKRAKKNAHDRERAIQKLLEKKSIKELMGNSGYKKYIQVEGENKIKIDRAKVEADKQWDGLRGVITNAKELRPEEVLQQYRKLWQIEEAFRVTKHDLKVRPVYHWTPNRIEAHLAIAFMAYTCVKTLEYRVKLQYQKLSPEVIRNELLHIQGSILQDKETNKRYFLPSRMSTQARKIYKLMDIKRETVPFELE